MHLPAQRQHGDADAHARWQLQEEHLLGSLALASEAAAGLTAVLHAKDRDLRHYLQVRPKGRLR